MKNFLFQMVIYLVCFDLSSTPQEQREQIFYWVQFLNSSVPNLPQVLSSINNNNTTSKFDSIDDNSDKNWRVMIVGLKSDLKSESIFTTESISNWQYQMCNLPLYQQRLFEVSSLHVQQSVRELLDSVALVCSQIFEKHAVLIPSSFRKLLQSIKDIDALSLPGPSRSSLLLSSSGNKPSSSFLTPFKELHQQIGGKVDITTFKCALYYLHAIGHIVFLQNGLVCTKPTMIPKLLAKFISPSEVQNNLLSENPNVQILSGEQIGFILKIKEENTTQYVKSTTFNFKIISYLFYFSGYCAKLSCL